MARRVLTLLAVGALSAFTGPNDPQRGEGAPVVAAGMDPAMPTLDVEPAGLEPPPPAKPFVLKAGRADREQALHCLTQAIYYEAAAEPLKGQQAVAQTVLNRLRHPDYPKSVCGVVFEGAMRATGCQFSFTCDGSLTRAPVPGLWKQAQGVARRALNGFVARPVGTATHYHADYVAPYWAPTLYKVTQVGAHIFYRWTGPAGEPPAFTGRYRGGEHNLTPAILQSLDERTQGDARIPGEPARTVTLGARTYKVADPAGGRVAGTIAASRRAPTPEEVVRINARLQALEAEFPTMGFSDDLPIGETSPKS